MLVCPKCKRWLQSARTPDGRVYTCRDCDGRAVPVDLLDRTVCKEFLWHLRPLPGEVHRDPPRRCPRCNKEMTIRHWGDEPNVIELDVCHPCRVVWFDDAEHHRTRLARHTPPPESHGPGDFGPDVGIGLPEKGWHFLPGSLGLPVELGLNRLRNTPRVTWGLISLMVGLLVALWLLRHNIDVGAVFAQWGWVAADPWRAGGLTFLTSFLLHAGWVHVLGNAYFLWVFGDNVEDRLGPGKYLMLLLGGHVTGLGLDALLTQRPDVPCVGASAGISAVLAYYAVMFPRAKIGLCGGWPYLFQFLRIPALVAILLYTALQGVGAWQTGRTGDVSVAYLAHLGGLGFGAVVAWLAALRRRQRVDAWR